MAADERIAGREQLVSKFGYWPTFHDAEVISLLLNRGSIHYGDGPSLETLIHVFELTNEVQPNGSYRCRHHCLVQFCFRGVEEIELSGFNHQNSLLGITFTDLRDRQYEHLRFEVSLTAAVGLDASFMCRDIEIVSVVPCDENGRLIES